HRHASARDLAQQALTHGSAQVTLTACDLAKRTEKILACDVLHDVSAHPKTEQALGVQSFVLHGEHEHAHVRMLAANPTDEVDAVVVAEREVHYRDIRLFARDHSLRVFDGGRFGGQDELCLPSEQLLQSFAHEGMIVHDHDPCLFGHSVMISKRSQESPRHGPYHS